MREVLLGIVQIPRWFFGGFSTVYLVLGSEPIIYYARTAYTNALHIMKMKHGCIGQMKILLNYVKYFKVTEFYG